MPRKKRKNKSSQKGRSPQNRRTNTKGYNTTGSAPAPIKMKYFEASIDELSGTFEERLAVIRQIGRIATEKFPKQYRSIQEWFKKYDQPKLLSFCFYYFLTSEVGYDEEAVTGKLDFPPFYQELLQSFSLTIPRSFEATPFSHEVKNFKNGLKEMGELYRSKQLYFPDTVVNAEDLPQHLLRIEMIMHTTAVRNWSYDHKMKRVTTDLAQRISSSFIAHHGFDPVVFLELLYTMTEMVEVKINDHKQKTIQFLTQSSYQAVITNYEFLFPVDKMPKDKYSSFWKHCGKNLKNLKAMFLLHSDYFLEDIFSFDYKTLASYTHGSISEEKLKEIFNSLSFEFGDLHDFDIDHFLLGNPVQDKPFIRLSDDTVFSTMYSVMTHFSLGLLENFCAQNSQLRQKYNMIRGVYLEDEVKRLFEKSFPQAQIFAGSQWKSNDGKQYENDLLVIIGKFALVIEAKAGMVSAPAKRGAPERLFRTLQDLIEDPSEQALRFIDFLHNNRGELSLKVKKGPNNRFNTTDLMYFVPLGVTLSHLGMTSSNLKQLIRAGVTTKNIEELATSVSFTDLEVILDLLPQTAEKLHYFQRRRELESNIEYMGDELDLLAWYLDDAFNLGTDQEKYGLFKMDLKAKELDHYIIGSAKNENVVKPCLHRSQWWKDILQRLEQNKPQNWLEVAYLLHNINVEDQMKLMQMKDHLADQVRAGTAKEKHNWILLHTGDKKRQFTIAVYCYTDRLKAQRNDVMSSILESDDMEGMKGTLVIAINVDQNHYPYSTLAFRSDPELFESSYLQIKN